VVPLGRLWDYKWSILACFIPLAVGGGFLVSSLMVPMYTASARIEVSPVIPQLVSSRSDMVPMYDAYRNSQVAHIRGPEVLDAVLDNPGVRAPAGYRAEPATWLEAGLAWLGLRREPPPRDRLSETLQIDAPRGNQNIFVSLATPRPGEAKLLVAEVVRTYKEWAEKQDADSDLDRLRKLDALIAEHSGEVTFNRTQTVRLRQQLGTGTPEALLNQRLLKLDDLISRQSSLRVRYEALVRAREDPNAVAAPVVFSLDTEWSARQRDVEAAAQQLRTVESQFGEDHPLLKRAQVALRAAEERLRLRETELRAAASGSADGEEAQRLRFELGTVATETEQFQAIFDQSFKAAEELTQRNEAIAEKEELVARLSAERERIKMNREVAGRIRTYAAYEPAEPDAGKRTKVLVAALVAALGASVGLAYLRLRLSPTVDDVGEALEPTNSTFLGCVPHAEPEELVRPQEASSVGEAVRLIRTALLRRLAETGGQVVQVTSGGAGSGKSTVALLLARSLAQSGRRVLLVDADLHQPVLQERLGLTSSVGLLGALAEPAAGADGYVEVMPGLHFLSTGARTRPGQRELLANGRFAALLEQWRGRYDLVLLDCAPLLGTADSVIVSGHVDGTVLVIRERHCRRAALNVALHVLHASGGRLLGTVYVSAARSGVYGYGYGYGPDGVDRQTARTVRAGAGEPATAVAPGGEPEQK